MPGRWLSSKKHPMVVTIFVYIIKYTFVVARSSLVSSHIKQIQMLRCGNLSRMTASNTLSMLFYMCMTVYSFGLTLKRYSEI